MEDLNTVEWRDGALVCVAYISCLFLVAWAGDRWGRNKRIFGAHPWAAALLYALNLAIYNTAWSYYGSVGKSATGALLDFLPIYIGPILVLTFGYGLIARVIAVSKSQRVTSVADFIANRYGRSQALSVLVTFVALTAVLPYIALQLIAIGDSFHLLIPAAKTSSPFAWIDDVFFFTFIMAYFTIQFGVQYSDSTRHHRGLMLAIAFESLIKLAVFVVVGAAVIVAFGPPTILNVVSDLSSARSYAAPGAAPPANLQWAPTSALTWIPNIVTSFIAFLCLPQLFHVAVIENESTPEAPSGEARRAVWFYAPYLAVLSVFVVGVAIVGLLSFGGSSHAMDLLLYVKKESFGGPYWALAVFIGGFSAATGMMIMSAVALSTMICNEIVAPTVYRERVLASAEAGEPRLPLSARELLLIRRACVAAIFLVAWIIQVVMRGKVPLTELGLMSFVVIAQLGPSFIGAVVWPRGTRWGAVAGILAGCGVAAVALIASIHGFITETVLHPGNPEALATLNRAIGAAALASLAVNMAAFVVVSLLTPHRGVGRRMSVEYLRGAPVASTALPDRLATCFKLDDLRLLLWCYDQQTANEFEDELKKHKCEGGVYAGRTALELAERLIGARIGATQAHHYMQTWQAAHIREKLEELVQEQTRELRNSNARLQDVHGRTVEFVQMISHQVINALSPLLIELGILARGDGKGIGAADPSHFRQMEATLAETLKLVRELVAMTIETMPQGECQTSYSSLAAELEVVSVGRVLWEEVDRCEEQARQRNITLTYVSCEALALSNAGRMREICRNLLSNALKFTKPGGRIVVGCRRRGDKMDIEVWDTGIGVSSEDYERVFQGRERETGPHGDPCNGLGLKHSREWARELGCDLEYCSEKGKGSRFALVRIPVLGRPGMRPARLEGPEYRL